MMLKKIPTSLQTLCLQSLCQALLKQWKNTYYTNYLGYSEQFIKEMSVSIPPTIHDQVFDLMVNSHARNIQDENTCTQSISYLVNSIICSTLHKLNLNCLRHMGRVEDEEIECLHSVLLCKLPQLDNLVEISLMTSGVDFTLPICTDEILKNIGSNCSKLRNLDVSYNHDVTDSGLQFLIPSEELEGCPKLVKVFLFECSVTHEGIVVLLEGLPKLKFLGYKETGQCLNILHSKNFSKNNVRPLELVHVNNLGTVSRTSKDFKKIACNSVLVNIISKLCPKLNTLKVRVNDTTVKCLQEVTSITILELVYNISKPSSPGNNTVQYLKLRGLQLVQLSFLCESFGTDYLKVICEECNNLKCLNISCKQFNLDKEIAMTDKKKCVLMNLEEFKFRIVGNTPMHDLCLIPLNIFNYVLHKSCVLKEVVLTMRNTLLCDIYIVDLFSSIETSRITKIVIQVPNDYTHSMSSQVSLTMMTVETLIRMCPELDELGQLLVWDVSSEEIEGLRRQLQLTNSALVIK